MVHRLRWLVLQMHGLQRESTPDAKWDGPLYTGLPVIMKLFVTKHSRKGVLRSL